MTTRLSPAQKKAFQLKIYNFYEKNKRSFPWRETKNPYQILVSEIMLQQTQTDRVLPKYELFIQTFPNFHSLAKASLSDVFNLWQGLGYNRRAKFLHMLAKVVQEKHTGVLPQTEEQLRRLPGIGPYTAAAIMTFAYNQSTAFIETNIRTVFIHEFFKDASYISDAQIRPLVEQTIDHKNPREWYYALMDFGVYIKKEFPNPNRKSKHYAKQSKFEGSNRQVRGMILKLLLKRSHTLSEIYTAIPREQLLTHRIINQMISEEMVIQEGQILTLA